MKNEFVKNSLILAGCVLGSLSAGFIGSFFTRMSVSDWYKNLNRPPLNPPGWVFGPVWTMLFILMGVALFLVLKQGFKVKPVTAAFVVFIIQMLFNINWSAMFFGLKSPLLGMINIVILWILILVNIILFFKVNRTAGWLLIPYLAWVSFATYLNAGYLILN